jgi:signal transduction histidine kinase
MWSEVMLSDSRPAMEEKARRALTAAQKQGQALSRQLMALARPESRSVTRFPLERPIQATVQTLTPALPPGTQLHFEAPVAPEVEADENEIQQVIYNLVLNARDAMPDGGSIQVSAGLVTSPIPIAVAGGSLAAGSWATISVTDSGPGIDPAIRHRIFDLFFTTKGPERGTGLGLATVMRIAKTSGGGVAVESEPGRGATFKVFLPALGGRQPEGLPAQADDIEQETVRKLDQTVEH